MSAEGLTPAAREEGHAAGGSQAPPRDHTEGVPRTHAWETVVWQDDLLGSKSAPGFPMSPLSLSRHEKVHCVLGEAKRKASVQFLLQVNAQSSGAHTACCSREREDA